MIANKLSMRKVKLADIFKQYSCKIIANHYLTTQTKIGLDLRYYSSYYEVSYQATIEHGIVFVIHRRIGKKTIDNINIFSSKKDALSNYYQRFENDVKIFKDYHLNELANLGKVGFFNNFIHKDKKNKIQLHERKLKDLETLYQEITSNLNLSVLNEENDNDNDTYQPYHYSHNIEVKRLDSLCIIDTRNPDSLKIEQVSVKKVIPFIDKKNQISLKIQVLAFDIDKIEMINLNFNNNHTEPEEGYHIFNCREKAYDFAIEELSKNQYKDKIKMKLKLAKKLDYLFG